MIFPSWFSSARLCECSYNAYNTEQAGLSTFNVYSGRFLLTYGAEPLLRSCQLCSHSKNFPAFYGTRRFITVFTRALHLSLSWASVQVRGFLLIFVKSWLFYGKELLVPRSTPKLEDNRLSVDRDCLFNIFVATLHIWRPSSPSTTWGHAMPWWQGIHLTWTPGGSPF
jgi:hypothetical protein